MNVLGISGSERAAAAAVSIDGAIVAAASEESFVRVPEIGYRYTGGFPLAAIEACLTRAGLTLADIHTVSVVADDRPLSAESSSDGLSDARQLFATSALEPLGAALKRREPLTIPAALGDARQLAAVCDGNLLILVLSLDRGESALCERRDGELKRLQPFPGGHQLFCVIRRMASALGLPPSAPYEAIERLAAAGSDSAALFDGAIRIEADLSVVVDEEEFERVIAPLRADGSAGRLPESRLEREAQEIAASFSARISAIVIDLTRRVIERAATGRIGVTGTVLSSGRLVRDLTAAFGSHLVLAPLPEATGRALGAALVHDDGHPIPRLQSLALGPDFSEQDIKTALENCRLDYLYEPDWSRLLARISAMLSRGTVVAWFQGAMGFGPRPIGTRGILCDPSNRWARENINRFLRHGETDDPLPVAMTAAALRQSVAAPIESPFLTVYADVRSEWRDRLRAAVDRRQSIPVQTVGDDQPLLSTLLDLHRQRTGVPGLINVPFCAANEPAVCAPRDAVRAVFSSAIDALVIGRFLLMKDYWLLRSGADA
jgi:carbamoyltransferase